MGDYRLTGSSPAHAGNSIIHVRGNAVVPVHPRACGELAAYASFESLANGSSPRMRGTQCNDRRQSETFRFIPAHAGNSHSPLPCDSRGPVHPRACGELFSKKGLNLRLHGSSPRMRGTPDRNTRRHSLSRFIPAHAGNSTRRPSETNRKPVHPRACGELSF